MRDAIVYGYDWAGASPVERVALAMARVGGTVLQDFRQLWHPSPVQTTPLRDRLSRRRQESLQQ